MPTFSFYVRGMDCAEETAALRKALATVENISDVTFDVLNARMNVATATSSVPIDQIIEAVKRTGLSAEPVGDSAPAPGAESRSSTLAISVAFGSLLAAIAFGLHVGYTGWRYALGGHDSGHTPAASRVLYLAAILVSGWSITPKAWLSAKRLRPDIHLLMAVAVAGAILLGDYLEAATVTILFAISVVLESWSLARARRAVAALLAIAPPRARVINDDESEEMVDASAVPVGTRLVVKPGEKFPLDGRITDGSTSVDQSPITGESTAVPKAKDSEVYAGSINMEGAVIVQTSRVATDTTLARIVRMVSEAQGKRAPSEQWVERFARVYTPLVLGLAVLVAVVPPLILRHLWSASLYQALVLLVIACPCALVISTPVSIVAGLISASRQGILIKGGRYLEAPAHLKAIALDKTGTLTIGRPSVQHVVPLASHSERELLEIAASLEMRSQHPLAHAIIQHAANSGLRPPPADDFQSIAGKGATATIDGKAFWVGSHNMLEERAQETPDLHTRLAELSESGASVVVIGEDSHVCGFIAASDTIRPEARQVISDLKSLGVQHVVMLTGDNAGTARVIASQAGIDECFAELLPDAKVAAVERLVDRFRVVAMVGDGVNDAPALARSSVAIAMGAAGTDAAIETADIALMNDELSRIPWLIRHSRRVVRTIRANITASLLVKAVFVGLTLSGKASLWGAIAADTGMSLLVVMNALRLLRDTKASRKDNHA